MCSQRITKISSTQINDDSIGVDLGSAGIPKAPNATSVSSKQKACIFSRWVCSRRHLLIKLLLFSTTPDPEQPDAHTDQEQSKQNKSRVCVGRCRARLPSTWSSTRYPARAGLLLVRVGHTAVGVCSNPPFFQQTECRCGVTQARGLVGACEPECAVESQHKTDQRNPVDIRAALFGLLHECECLQRFRQRFSSQMLTHSITSGAPCCPA